MLAASDFCCACCILVFTSINLSIGLITSGKITSWGTLNCAKAKDDYDDAKDDSSCDDDCLKYRTEWLLNECQRKKGMYDMEYTSFIFDIVIGFVCGLIGLLHLFDLKKDFVSNTGLIGLGCGVVGFVLTFVYVVFNGIVYTKVDTAYFKMDSDGAFAELKGDKYECFYYDKATNEHALKAKYSDLIKKQYNYDKDLIEEYYSNEVFECTYEPLICLSSDNGNIPKGRSYQYTNDNGDIKDCQYLYYKTHYSPSDEMYSWRYAVTNKDLSDRFLTTLILSLFVCLANIGLALFGFLLFRNPSDF